MIPLVDRAAHWALTRPDATAYGYVDHTLDQAGTRHTLTWRQVDTRARAIAARIRQQTGPGERVAILAPSGLDYVTAFLGAAYARVIAVPLFTPDLPAHGERLLRSFNDSAPAAVLTTGSALAQVEDFLSGEGVAQPGDLVCVDEVSDLLAAQWQPEPARPEDTAYLQYTSGSTSAPAGVVITHANLTANAEQIWTAFEAVAGRTTLVSWLPLFHDMGLMLTVLAPLTHGDSSVFTDPVSFLLRPARWLELAAGAPHDVYTAGPNFAYDYCAKRVTEEEKATLDLSRVRVFMNGAEPIRAATVSRFTAAFARCGLRPEAPTAVYGLAEATVFVATAPPRDPMVTTLFDADALLEGRAQKADGASPGVELVACGRPGGQQVLIADPETGEPCAPGRVGEIRISGPNVARTYWGSTDRSAEVFAADGWLRSGDLGVFHDDQLYVTGRLKDLVILDGRNHYPQDIEATVHAAHPGIRPGRAVAFAAPGADTERLVVVVEY
ncbi:fatty acyl-AMP ligase [Kitasatospora sp. Root107]|uniref:fatty acyl-AMP ligase n=1 Tax=Kitasatospora sp. Root107 TaxID=1736424 RepID=UPI000A86E4EE